MSTLINLKQPEPDLKRLYLLVAIIFLLLFSIALLSGCYTSKQCERMCNSNNRDSVSIRIDTVTQFRFDTAYKYVDLPGPIILLDNPCANLCDSLGKLKPINKVVHKNGIITTIKSVNGNLIFETRIDSLLQVNKEKDVTIKVLKESFEEKLMVITSCTETWWQVLYRFGFWILLIIASVFCLASVNKFLKSMPFK